MKVKFIFAWYDFWIGLYYDRKDNIIYILPLPMLGLKIKLDQNLIDLVDRLKPHYEIIGYYTKKPIGCTIGKKDWPNILAEEPLSTFRRCKRKDCHICGKEV